MDSTTPVSVRDSHFRGHWSKLRNGPGLGYNGGMPRAFLFLLWVLADPSRRAVGGEVFTKNGDLRRCREYSGAECPTADKCKVRKECFGAEYQACVERGD